MVTFRIQDLAKRPAQWTRQRLTIRQTLWRFLTVHIITIEPLQYEFS
jgi:hypothetical protein